MAAFEALERLQKFDWLIQKLHSLRNNLHSEAGLQELQKLHALQLLQRSDFPVHHNGSGGGESEDDKMEELCKNGAEDEEEEEEEEEIFNEEEEEEEEELDEEEEEEEVLEEEYDQQQGNSMDNEQLVPLALTTSGAVDVKAASPVQSAAGTAVTLSPSFRGSASTTTGFPMPLPPPLGRSQGGRGGPQYPMRFPTGLFPPLPFESLLSEQELQVRNFTVVVLC